MIFKSIAPKPELAHLVREYWIYENASTTPARQKVIPDGYCEIVVHYGDRYRIRLYDQWEEQSRLLLAGQIRRSFFLENTGRSMMLGIKLHPVAPSVLFGIQMQEITDRVIPLEQADGDAHALLLLTQEGLSIGHRVEIANAWLTAHVPEAESRTVSLVRRAVDHFFEMHGMIGVQDVASTLGITPRHLERIFKPVVGLSPKYFARIIRFGYIFKAIEAGDKSWVEVALDSGYFDQSHFIKNFAAFSGERPAQYGFDEDTLANFFLRR